VLDEQSRRLPPFRLLEGHMIKSMLVLRVAEQIPHPFAKDVKKAVYTIFDEIEAALVRGDRVELRGFGAFFIKPRPARLRRNPRSGAAVSLPETFHPMFRTGKEMKARLNGTAGRALRAAFHKPLDNVPKSPPSS
jgi:integration host factor subunit beta